MNVGRHPCKRFHTEALADTFFPSRGNTKKSSAHSHTSGQNFFMKTSMKVPTKAPTLDYRLKQGELVTQSQLESKVLAVEVDPLQVEFLLVENLGDTQGVTSIEHKIAEFIRQTKGDSNIERFHHIVVDVGFCAVCIQLGREIDSRLNASLKCKTFK